MDERTLFLIHKLCETHSLERTEYEYLISGRTAESARLLAEKAGTVRDEIYGHEVFVRGLIEFTNYCRNDCYYCGIRKSNEHAERYRLTEDEILECCGEGYDLGFRTYVLQGGEDPYFTDARLERIVRRIHTEFPECAITLSVGERSPESYRRLRAAGAERYLLRHETASKEHYGKLHPESMSFNHRMQCLKNLRDAGFAVGCGFMVGSPGQDAACLAMDLKLVENFHPEMCGIGPFVPHKDTPFAKMEGGTVELTCFLLSVLRLIYPPMLIPATTALGTIDPNGREKGIRAGANVVMPNLSPVGVRKKYELYDNKICTGEESASCRGCLERRMLRNGYYIVTDRGDMRVPAIR